MFIKECKKNFHSIIFWVFVTVMLLGARFPDTVCAGAFTADGRACPRSGILWNDGGGVA